VLAIKRFFLFVLLLFIFDRSISFLICKFNYLVFGNYRIEEPLTKYLKSKDFNTLILGTSRTYEGLHPSLLKSEKVVPFKWGYQGHGPEYNYYFYKLYKKIYKIPRLLIYGMDYFIYNISSSTFSLNEIGKNKAEELLEDFFSPSLLLLRNKSQYDILLNDILKIKNNPDVSLYKRISDMQNYTGVQKSLLKGCKVNTIKPLKMARSPFFRPPGREGIYFTKLLDELNSDNVKVVLVVIPDYIGTYKTNFSHKIFRRHVRRLEDKYKNIKIINYNIPGRFNLKNESLFLDGGYGFSNSHLSKKGAKLFNSLINHKLSNIILK